MVRTYKATRFDVAIERARRELGGDAVLIESRQLPLGRGVSDPRVEITAMSRADAVASGVVDAGGNGGANGSQFARRLRHVGVPTQAAEAIGRATVKYYGGEPPTLACGRHALARALAEEMTFHDPRTKGARVVALVGGTGVGKTTTIAKIAAVAALVDRRTVGMVSIDQYRIGGSEQLERYAELIGCPMEIAHDARSLEISLRRLSGAQLVLVDTAGRSPRDIAALAEMADTLHGVGEPVDVCLCITASTRDPELRDIVERHDVLRPTRLVSTKVDEAYHLGPVLAAQFASKLPLSWITTGQRVPEDLEPASPERLAALISGSEEE